MRSVPWWIGRNSQSSFSKKKVAQTQDACLLLRNMSDWTVETKPPRPGGRKGKVNLLFQGKVILQNPIGYHPWDDPDNWEPSELKLHSFQLMADSYNERKWKPSSSPAVLAGARILQDALTFMNGRKIDHVTNRSTWISITVHAGCFYRFSWPTLRPKAFASHELGWKVEFNDKEEEAFLDLIDTERLRKKVEESLIMEREDQTRGGKGDRKTLTQKEQKIADDQERLDRWKEKHND